MRGHRGRGESGKCLGGGEGVEEGWNWSVDGKEGGEGCVLMALGAGGVGRGARTANPWISQDLLVF